MWFKDKKLNLICTSDFDFQMSCHLSRPILGGYGDQGDRKGNFEVVKGN